MSETVTSTDRHILVAHLTGGRTVRCGTGDHNWHGAQTRWHLLDDARRESRAPGVEWFAVRSVADPSYRDLPELSWFTPELFIIDPAHPKGFTNDTAAAAALGHQNGISGTRKPDTAGGFIGRSGSGGWLYRNGRTVCQGWGPLTARWTRLGYIREIDGRWYLLEGATP